MGAISKALQSANRAAMTTEIKDVERLLNELEDFNLTNWESEFVANLLDQLSIYQGEFFLTPAQGDWLNRLADKYDLVPS